MQFILCKQASYYQGIVDLDLNILKRVIGLQASAGIIIFPRDEDFKGAVFVDGRYELAANLCVNHDKFDIEDFGIKQVENWIRKNLKTTDVILIDSKYFTLAEYKALRGSLSEYSFENIELHQYFQIKTSPKTMKLYDLKHNRIDECLEWTKRLHQEAYLFCDPSFISWMLGIRDLNTKYSRAILGYLLVKTKSDYVLYPDDAYSYSDLPFTCKKLSELRNDINKLQSIGVDYNEISSAFDSPNLVDVKCPIDQSIKTDEEIDQIKLATKYDSIAFIKFLYWFHTTKENFNETRVIEKIEEFRRECPNYIGNSFETISAINDHSAIVHYSSSKKSQMKLKKSQNKILLIDSGGQYKNGTTDITRTVSHLEPTLYEKSIYTCILKGHIALAGLKFPEGTTGAQLDAIARQHLWNNYLDFQHGTGHGIGYLLNVHEGKFSISKQCNSPIKVNMLLSNEPGYYKPEHFGVRLENMMIVKRIDKFFIGFDIISLIPFEPKFICYSLLSDQEKTWINEYHRSIYNLCIEFNLPQELLCWFRNYYLREKVTSQAR